MLDRALSAKRESKYIDFKAEFDPDSNQDWCEIIKDLVAMANSGGGLVLFGVANNGKPQKTDLSKLNSLDPAAIADKVFKYTGVHFAEFMLSQESKDGKEVTALKVGATKTPIVFSKPGTYQKEDGKQGRAFSQGAIYFRHGAKSEPGITSDVAKFIEKEMDAERKHLLKGLRQVISAPKDHQVRVVSAQESSGAKDAVEGIRLVDNDVATPYHLINPDVAHPYRQSEVIKELKERAGIRTYHHALLCVGRKYGIEDNPNYFYQPLHSSPQYSSVYIDWLIAKYEENPTYIRQAIDEYRKQA